MTTTPAQVRRALMTLAVLLVVEGLALVGQAVYFHSEQNAQRACLATQFRELTLSLDARADLTQRETDENRRLWSIYAEAAGLLKDDPTAELPPKEQKALQIKLVAELLNYPKVLDQITKDRKEHPIPPYPVGRCD